ncbi:hypothetical protein BHE90_015099 [Fusarium euwallaceae]|uniref:Nucleoside phosphorylase domain-containing protein n=1 Tax=Fusarium euwallaceae TaxID=1147111 RepID=A0A430L444_9HYPO|nr:hypothetical protein BHE90_015099 [Fusarium euwallaceae]
MTNTPKLEDYTIIIFSPLVIEQKAACLMLDEIHDGIPERSAGQTVLYTLGKIGSHNVAIAGYPAGEVGIGVSGSMVSEALRDFPNLEAGILVGIAAGIPSPKRDIRLGDVAVAIPNSDNPGVIGYDLAKVEEDGVRLKQWQNSTHALLRSAIASIQVHESRPESSFTRHLDILWRAAEFKRPGHVLANSELLTSNARDGPIAHYGTILSGNGVIKSKKKRDELRDKYDGIAIEMEAAGMTTRLPVAVVRGISDFADSHKNDEWHRYAAATAAAYAKEMLIRLGPRKRTESASQSAISSDIDTGLRLSLPEKCSFVGREAELSKLEEWVGFCPEKMSQKSVVTLWGIAGVGKSQLVSEFVKQQREKYPGYDIFWIAGATKEAFEQSILSVLKVGDNPEATISEGSESYDEQRSMLIRSVRQYVEKWRAHQLYHEYPTNMALLRSLELSFEELEKTNTAAAKLLMLFGYLDHRDLWADLCLNATDDDLPAWLREIGSSKCFHGYYASMRNLSFVEAKSHGRNKDQAYEIHPAIHEFARWKAKENEEEYVRTAISLVAAKVPRSTDKDFLEIVQRLEPHADQCKIHMEQGRAGSSLDLLELEQFGNLFRHLGRYDEASRLYERILNVINREDEPDEFTLEMVAGIENNLGLIHHARRQYDLALRAYNRSYLRRLQIVPRDDDSLMATQYNKGRAFLMLGRLDEALQTLLEAAAHFSQRTSPGALNDHGVEGGNKAMAQIYFRILNDVGEIYLRKNDVEQAEQNFRRAFSGHKKYFHEMHPATFAVRLNIGRVCIERSRFSTANKIFEYIITTYTEWWGRRHSETMRALTELAESHMRHAEKKRLMGDGGDWELTMAADLWGEIISFHQEVSGSGSDAASFARSKLQQVQLLRSATLEDPYSMYYSSGS